MITERKLKQIITKSESYRIERTITTDNADKFCQAICAFSNDISGSGKNGYLIIGASHNGSVVFQNGTIGVISCIVPIEEAKNDPVKLYIDIGCITKEDAENYVKVGDYCGHLSPYRELKNNRIATKSLDNRAGCYVLVEAMKLNKGDKVNDIYYVFTVQEELGCRGAITAAERIKPDIGVAVDISPDHFFPCDLEGSNAVGEGVGVKVGDPSAITDEYLLEEMLKCCEANEIKYQRDVMSKGGTDSSSMNRAYYGARVAGISVITRFPHNHTAVASTDDILAAIKLVDKYKDLSFNFTS
jgi:endoglucanase